ncbi:unnamed protein product, partial [marine sediment metagenome]
YRVSRIEYRVKKISFKLSVISLLRFLSLRALIYQSVAISLLNKKLKAKSAKS